MANFSFLKGKLGCGGGQFLVLFRLDIFWLKIFSLYLSKLCGQQQCKSATNCKLPPLVCTYVCTVIISTCTIL